MPRVIEDDYELPEFDDLPLEEKLRRRRGVPFGVFVAFTVLILIGAGIYSYFYFVERQTQDAFCATCHTTQHETYLKRAESSVAGSLAPDLSSFHYQQIRGQGGNIRCIDCHRGDDGARHRIETMGLSARMSLIWLVNGGDKTLEKTSRVVTSTDGITRMLGTDALVAPSLSNDGCVTCHETQLLVAGQQNHFHNTLPIVYERWKNGARLSAPNEEPNAQALLARGLVRIETSVTCSNCHQVHRSTEEENYLNVRMKDLACEHCHRESGR
jgi:hypothetical protein